MVRVLELQSEIAGLTHSHFTVMQRHCAICLYACDYVANSTVRNWPKGGDALWMEK